MSRKTIGELRDMAIESSQVLAHAECEYSAPFKGLSERDRHYALDAARAYAEQAAAAYGAARVALLKGGA